MMTMDENRQAILLLSVHFSAPAKGALTPLTAIEYGRFALWMKGHGFQPKDLFHRFHELLKQWQDSKGKIDKGRLQYLLGRGLSMGMALEKWQSAGIWFITRSDPEYPVRLKNHLKETAPAILFGIGNKQLLNKGGLSIVGSRNIGETEQRYTKQVAQQAAMEGMNVVSGGAKGVDEIAMISALKVDGTALGVLANDLLKKSLSGKWRNYLKNGQLVLISPFYPEARFQVGNAMGRNKYIYCLSDYALVVRAEEGKGGTWTGAVENLKKNWVPLFVSGQSDAAGNLALISRGVAKLNAPDAGSNESGNWLHEQLDFRQVAESEAAYGNISAQPKVDDITANSRSTSEALDMPVVVPVKSDEPKDVLKKIETEEPYEEFVKELLNMISQHGEATLAMLKETRQDLSQKKITGWLDRACDEGLAERKGRRRIYTMIGGTKTKMKKQGELFYLPR